MPKVKTITYEYNSETRTLTFDVVGGGQIEFGLGGLSEDIAEALLVHGAAQKVSDAAAIAKDALTGDPKKDGKLKLDRMVAVRDRLVSGDWRKPAEGSASVAGIIFRAYVEWATEAAKSAKKPVPSDEKFREMYEGKSRSEKLALKSVPAIAEIMNRLRAEKAPSVDADALLAELLA